MMPAQIYADQKILDLFKDGRTRTLEEIAPLMGVYLRNSTGGLTKEGGRLKEVLKSHPLLQSTSSRKGPLAFWLKREESC